MLPSVTLPTRKSSTGTPRSDKGIEGSHRLPLPDPPPQCGEGTGGRRGTARFRACAMFSLFERLLKPTDTPERAEPPGGFVAFFWHFASQAKGLFAALFAAGFVVALLDSTIPVFMGRIITLITASPPVELFEKFWPHLVGMALVLLVARPLAL